MTFAAPALALAGLGIFWVSGFRDRISSDAAATLLLARHMLNTHAWLPPDWYYANGDIWIVGPQLFALPFVAYWGVTPLALACANALGLGCVFGSALVLARVICRRTAAAALVAVSCIALYSHFQREFVVMQLSYGWMAAKLMLLLSLVVLWMRSAEGAAARSRRLALLAGYAALLTVWAAENPLRPAAYLVIPLAASLAVNTARQPASRHRAGVLAVATLLAMIAGWLLHRRLAASLLMAPGLEAFRLAPVAEWPLHLRLLAEGMRHIYGGDPLGAPQALMLDRMLGWVRAASVPCLLMLFVREGLMRASAPTTARLPVQVACAGIGVVTAALVAGSIMVDAVSARYLIPVWMLALVVLAAACVRNIATWPWLAGLLTLAFPLGGLVNAMNIRNAHSSVDAAGLPHPPALDAAIAALNGSGFTHGFASHRYANAIDVRSGDKLRACDLLVAPEVRPLRFFNARACFDRVLYADGFFVLLAPEMRDARSIAKLRETIGVPYRVIDVEECQIWLYPEGSGDLGWLVR
ncbi:MAG: hypothetical protein ACHP7D_10440 [Lysobacterales bacterium]